MWSYSHQPLRAGAPSEGRSSEGSEQHRLPWMGSGCPLCSCSSPSVGWFALLPFNVTGLIRGGFTPSEGMMLSRGRWSWNIREHFRTRTAARLCKGSAGGGGSPKSEPFPAQRTGVGSTSRALFICWEFRLQNKEVTHTWQQTKAGFSVKPTFPQITQEHISEGLGLVLICSRP